MLLPQEDSYFSINCIVDVVAFRVRVGATVVVSSLVTILLLQASHKAPGECEGLKEASGERGQVFLAKIFKARVADEFLESSYRRKPVVKQVSGSAIKFPDRSKVSPSREEGVFHGQEIKVCQELLH